MQNLARGVKIFQLPLLYFTPLVTNIGESLSLATPVTGNQCVFSNGTHDGTVTIFCKFAQLIWQ